MKNKKIEDGYFLGKKKNNFVLVSWVYSAVRPRQDLNQGSFIVSNTQFRSVLSAN